VVPSDYAAGLRYIWLRGYGNWEIKWLSTLLLQHSKISNNVLSATALPKQRASSRWATRPSE
jgi:hypothetical protein